MVIIRFLLVAILVWAATGLLTEAHFPARSLPAIRPWHSTLLLERSHFVLTILQCCGRPTTIAVYQTESTLKKVYNRGMAAWRTW